MVPQACASLQIPMAQQHSMLPQNTPHNANPNGRAMQSADLTNTAPPQKN